MASSNGSDAGTLTRRDAIAAALAIGAGSLLALKPATALAANGATMTVGGLFTGNLGTVLWHTASGDLGPIYSQAVLAGTDPQTGVHWGLEGEVAARAGTGAVGVRGHAEGSDQSGVLAENTSATGTALQVNGRASFSRSGRATVTKGASYCTVAGLSGIDSNSLIFVTPQADPGVGVQVAYARPLNATSFRVVLTAPAKKTLPFAWMILN